MTKPYTSRKLRNDLRRIDPSLDVQIRPVSVNGVPFGCSGFVTDPATGTVVYVRVDHNHGRDYDRALYRTAERLDDYSGGRNHLCAYSDLAQNIVGLLRSDDPLEFEGEDSYSPL